MQIQPLVTIAIPVYNAANYIGFAIRSVINQTYNNWELFLINDGSSDESLDIMYSYAAIDSRIKIINDGENKGLVSRLNQSVSEANGKYYARMDADDIMFRSRLIEQVNFLEDNPGIDVLGSSIMTIDDKNNIIGSGFYHGKVNSFVHPTIMGRTAWFINNPYHEWAVRAEDFELWCRTSEFSNFWVLDKPLLFYREFGVPVLAKSVSSLKTKIKIYSRYRDYQKTVWWAVDGILKSMFKIIIYYFLSFLKMTKYIARMRKRPRLPEDLLLNNADLQTSIKY